MSSEIIAHTGRSWRSPEVIVGIVAVVFAAMIGIAAILIAHWDADQLKETVAGKFEFSNEKITLDGKPYRPPRGPSQLQFWTPSVHTKETPGVKDWERLDNDDRLNEFADRLKKAKIITGYRRYEVMGAGITERKSGAWWVATNGDDLKLAEFLKLYEEFWRPGDDNVYMEIAPVSSGYSR